MANRNSYKPNRFRSDLPKIKYTSDANNATPALGDDYEEALDEVKGVISSIKKELTAMNTQVKSLRDNKKSGTEIKTHCNKAMKKIESVKKELNDSLKEFTNTVDAAEKDELKRMRKWVLDSMRAGNNQ